MATTQLRTLQMGNDWFGERQGGLNRVYSELLMHLPDIGVQVQGLVVGSERVAQSTGGVITSFALAKAPLPSRLYHGRQAALRILREQKPDMIVSHFALYTFAFADHLRSTPTVVHFQGPWAAEAGVEGQSSLAYKMQSFIERTVYQRARRIIVLSHAFQEELVRRYGVADEIVRVVPAGVDVDVFNDSLTRVQARERLGWPTDRPIILAVRRQVRRMGLENLVEATLEIRKRVPEVLVLLGGTGPLMAELRERIEVAGLQNNVRQLGRIEDADLPIAYRASDLTVVPTQALEGFGMITLESLASGTPVLVTPVGGLPEVVRPFAPECVFDGMTTPIMAETIGDFLTGVRTLPNSDACRRYAVTNYSWPHIAERVKQVYVQGLA